MCDANTWLAIALVVFVAGIVSVPIIIALRGGYDEPAEPWTYPEREPTWKLTHPKGEVAPKTPTK